MSEGDAGRDDSRGSGSAAPGWYPDPQGSGALFYWDGEQWTGDARAPAEAPGKATPQRDHPRIAVIGGGVAFGLSTFLPWVKVILLGNLNLFQLFTATGGSSVWAWLVLLAGGGVAAVGFRNSNRLTIRRLGLSVGLVGGVVAILALEGLLNELRDAHGLATVGIGPYVAVGGCIAMVIGAVMMKRKSAAAHA